MSPLDPPSNLTLCLRGGRSQIWMLDDRGVRVGMVERAGGLMRISWGEFSETCLRDRGSPLLRTYRLESSGDGPPLSIYSRLCRHQAFQGDRELASFRYPLLQLRSHIPEAILGGAGRVAAIHPAAMGVRLVIEAKDPVLRRLAFFLYLCSLESRVPPPSAVRHLVFRAL